MLNRIKVTTTFAALAACATFASAATCGEGNLLSDWVNVASAPGDLPSAGLGSAIRFTASPVPPVVSGSTTVTTVPPPTSNAFLVETSVIPKIPLTCNADGTLRSTVQGGQYIITILGNGNMMLDRFASGATSWTRSYYAKAATMSYTLGAELARAGRIWSMSIYETGNPTLDRYTIITTDKVSIPTTGAVLYQLFADFPYIPTLIN
jgi:hypothetical protein